MNANPSVRVMKGRNGTSDFAKTEFPPARLFDGLTHEEVDLVLSAAKLHRYGANSVIYRQGESADHFLLLREGRARYFYRTPNGKKLILRWILPGYAFGWAGLSRELDHYVVSAETVQDSVVLAWDTRTIHALTQRLPRLLENGFFIVGYLLSWYVAAHAALCSRTAQERLSHVLFEYSTKIGRKVAEGFEFDATNEELATAAHVTPFIAKRLLTAWERKKLIQKVGGSIVLRCPERLFQHTKESDGGALGTRTHRSQFARKSQS
jgi:CRP/FNR family transcriptional regulator, nitrogen oxide reductase regulator